MKKLAEINKDKVIDVLTERLAFERAGVKAYDSIIAKMEKSSDPAVKKMLGVMREHRDQEKEHEEWLEEQVRSLGGDVNAMTEHAKLIEEESEGIEKVVFGSDTNISHMFHALLTAELMDNAGWELLIQLADEADDDEARRAFKKRLHEEEEHLIFARRAVMAFARKEVLKREQPMPSSVL